MQARRIASLAIDQLTLSYGRHEVLSGLNHVFRPGVHFLVGENGAGKTTLLNALSGLLSPRSGAVLFQGGSLRDRQTLRHFKARSGHLAQTNDAPTGFTASEFLEYCCWLKGVSSTALASRAAELLRIARLEDHAEERLKKLSGGMRRRLCFVAELAADPSVLLLDEPSAGIDAGNRGHLLDLVSARARDGAVVIAATHHVPDIVDLGGTVLVLGRGGILASVAQAPGASLGADLTTYWKPSA